MAQLEVAGTGALAQPLAGRKLLFLQSLGAEAEGADLRIGQLCFCSQTCFGSCSAGGTCFLQSIWSNVKHSAKLCQNTAHLPGVLVRNNRALEALLSIQACSRMGCCLAASTAEVKPWAWCCPGSDTAVWLHRLGEQAVSPISACCPWCTRFDILP